MSISFNKNNEIKIFNSETETKGILQKDIESDNISIFDETKLSVDDNDEDLINDTKTESEKTSTTNFSFKNIIDSIIEFFTGNKKDSNSDTKDTNTRDTNTKDGKIGNTKQGNFGDCYLLSGINSLSYTEKGQEIIKNALDYQDDGSTIVHLATGDVVVTQDEINYAKNSEDYSSGDDDMIIFELAINKTLKDIEAGNIDIPDKYDEDTDSNINEGRAFAIFYIITGQNSEKTSDNDKKMDVLNYFEKMAEKIFQLLPV